MDRTSLMDKWPPLSAMYGLGDKLNKWIQRSPYTINDAYTVSVGNLTTGGTGKTPATIYLAKLMLNEGLHVGILSRGYGGSLSKKGSLLSDGSNIFCSVSEAGDEPIVISKNVRGAKTAICRERYLAAQIIKQSFDVNFFLLDDGFQHYRLARDLDIVLIDATNPFGNGKLLPHGILREPLENLERSDIIILTKTDLVDEHKLKELEELIIEKSKHEKIFFSNHQIVGLVPGNDNYEAEKKETIEPVEKIKGKSVWAISGIGNHNAFESTLLKAGAQDVKSITFRDHHNYSTQDIKSIISRVAKGDIIITTEKDYVKLMPFSEVLTKDYKFYYLKIEFNIIKNELILKEGIKAKLMLKKPALYKTIFGS